MTIEERPTQRLVLEVVPGSEVDVEVGRTCYIGTHARVISAERAVNHDAFNEFAHAIVATRARQLAALQALFNAFRAALEEQGVIKPREEQP